MNRERLQILRDHLASLPDERVDMRYVVTQADGRQWNWKQQPKEALADCGTAACIAGWCNALFPHPRWIGADAASETLELDEYQNDELFTPDFYDKHGRYTRQDAIAAIQSMLDSPDDDALPVWPEASA